MDRPVLSTNWKQLQARIKNEASVPRAKNDVVMGAKVTKQRTKRDAANTRRNFVSKCAKRRPREHLPPTTGMGAVHSSCGHDSLLQPAPPEMLILAEACSRHSAPHITNTPPPAIIAETLTDAFSLGTHGHGAPAGPDTPNIGFIEGVEVGKYVAMDCEMVGVGRDGMESSLARVSLVDFHGRLVYDSFVRPSRPVTDWRTSVSGITVEQMKHARRFDQVQRDVSGMIKDRMLVGHDLRHDLGALMLSHAAHSIRDTSKLGEFRRHCHGKTPALKQLAHDLLGLKIQEGTHSSIEDARATMLLFRKYKSQFDADHISRYGDCIVQRGTDTQAKTKPPKTKKKKKKKKKK